MELDLNIIFVGLAALLLLITLSWVWSLSRNTHKASDDLLLKRAQDFTLAQIRAAQVSTVEEAESSPSISINGLPVSSISLNGLQVEVRGRQLYVNGQLYTPADGTDGAEEPKQYTLVLDQEGVIKGPIDGPLVVESTGNVTLRVEGNIRGSVRGAHSIEVSGDVGGSVDTKGSVSCSKNIKGSVRGAHAVTVQGGVGGSVQATTVNCGDVGNTVRASGNVTCGNVGGSASAGGNMTCGNVGSSARSGRDMYVGQVKGPTSALGSVQAQ